MQDRTGWLRGDTLAGPEDVRPLHRLFPFTLDLPLADQFYLPLLKGAFLIADLNLAGLRAIDVGEPDSRKTADRHDQQDDGGGIATQEFRQLKSAANGANGGAVGQRQLLAPLIDFVAKGADHGQYDDDEGQRRN